MVSLVAFLLIGPYSYLAGAISLDLGGKRGGATACGIIDGIGYLFGGVLAGMVIARQSETLGWQGVFVLLAGAAGATAMVAAWFLAIQFRSSKPALGAGVRDRGARGSGLMRIVEEILELFAARGAAAYHGEAVSQEEHALQAAELAEREGAPDALVVAALLHDVGHLLDGQDEDLAVRGVDGRHEEEGCAWLSRHFGPEVTEPIRLHVAAKRYLCAVDPSYLAGLSPASRLSLKLQGGPMNPDEVAAFEANASSAMPCACGTGTTRPRCRAWRCRGRRTTEGARGRGAQ